MGSNLGLLSTGFYSLEGIPLLNLIIYLEDIELLRFYLKVLSTNKVSTQFIYDKLGNHPFEIALSSNIYEIPQILIDFANKHSKIVITSE